MGAANELRRAAVPGQVVIDPADWKPDDFKGDPRWLFRLEEEDVRSLRSMAHSLREAASDDPSGLLNVPASAFDCGIFAKRLRALRGELKDGYGAVLIRGLPMGELSSWEAAAIYWAIGRELGTPCANNPQGDMIGHVTDLGKTQKEMNSRGYQTREELAFHSDQSTIVGLLCVRAAKAGGISKICSSVAVYNELLKRSPRSAEVLSQPLCWSKMGEVDQGQRGYYESPVFCFLNDTLCTSFGPLHILKGHQLPGAPAITEQQREAVDRVKALSEELHYAMELQPGDIQLLNNLVVFHSRTEYEDWPDPSRKRLLWRLWLNATDIRPSTPFITRWQAGVKPTSALERIILGA